MEGILLEITHFKQELDAIDKELDEHIRMTKELESEVVATSEILQNVTEKEMNCKTATIEQENQLQSVIILIDQAKNHFLQEKRNLQGIEESLENVESVTCDERKHFISCCKHFEADVGKLIMERQRLLWEKNNLNNKIMQVTGDLDSMAMSQTFALHGKRSISEKLSYNNKDLRQHVHENKKSIHDVECHISKLTELQAVNDRLFREIQENEEAIRQLKDMVTGLEIQLSHLIH